MILGIPGFGITDYYLNINLDFWMLQIGDYLISWLFLWPYFFLLSQCQIWSFFTLSRVILNTFLLPNTVMRLYFSTPCIWNNKLSSRELLTFCETVIAVCHLAYSHTPLSSFTKYSRCKSLLWAIYSPLTQSIKSILIGPKFLSFHSHFLDGW